MEKKERLKHAVYEAIFYSTIFIFIGLINHFKNPERHPVDEQLYMVFFIVILSFIKGYIWGSSIVKSRKDFKEKIDSFHNRPDMTFRCFKCSKEINVEDKKCPECGWTWE